MAEIKLQADDTRIATIKFEDGAGANKDVTIPAAGGLLNVLTQGTAVTATGTAIDFTGIPSTAKRITVMFDGLSTNGGSSVVIRLGTSSGIEASGYSGSVNSLATGGAAALITDGLWLERSGIRVDASISCGVAQFTNINGNIWIGQQRSASQHAAFNHWADVAKETSGVVDRIRITTVNGTDAFDAGSINIMWE